jgi:hypothetical protein
VWNLLKKSEKKEKKKKKENEPTVATVPKKKVQKKVAENYIDLSSIWSIVCCYIAALH